MTAFALPAAVLDAIFGSEAAPELGHQAVELDDEGILELFAGHQRARGLSPHTLKCYRSVYRAFVRALHARGLTLLTASRDDVGGWIYRPALTVRGSRVASPGPRARPLCEPHTRSLAVRHAVASQLATGRRGAELPSPPPA
jgi:hypothetical protein